MSAEASTTTSPTIQKKDDSSSSTSPVAAAQQQQQQQPLLSNKQFLKQLEKSWKPFPPWCVSSKRVPEDLNEELSLFSNLIAPTSVEMKQLTQLQETIQKAIISGTSTTSTTVSTSGCTAAGFGLIEGPLFFSVDTTSNTNDSSEASAKIVAALLETKLFDESVAPVVKDESKRMKSGYSIRLREAQSNSQTSRNVILYFGEAAIRSRKMGALLKSGFESTNAQACIAAWHVLMSSLKQTRNLDDTEPTALSSDAAATMMLSVANSYDTAPTCSQALTDFFLLYGFATSFDMSSKSVTIKGALVDVPKVHNTEAMSVIDPLLAEYDGYRGGGGAAHDFDVETLTAEKDSESVTNLAAGMTTASVNRLVNIFAYCYRVIAEYSRGRAEQERGRAESTLSTFLGGGPFWTRVVVLSEQGCDPYPEIVQHGLTAASNNNNSSASAGGGNKAVRNNNNNNNGKNNNYYNNSNNNNYNNGRGGRGYNRGGRGGGGRGNNNNNGYHHQNSTFVPHHHHHHHHHQFAMPTPHHQSMMMNTNNSTFQPHHQHHQQQFLSQQDMILLPTPNSRTSPPAAVLPANANNNAASGFQQPQQNRQQW